MAVLPANAEVWTPWIAEDLDDLAAPRTVADAVADDLDEVTGVCRCDVDEGHSANRRGRGLLDARRDIVRPGADR